MSAKREAEARRDVSKFLSGLNEAWVQGRFAELERYFHDDVVMMPPGAAEPVRGRAACVQSYVDFATRATGVEYEQSEEHVDFFGQTAVASYRFDIAYRLDGAEHRDRGRDAFVLVRTSEGWRAVWRTMVLLPANATGSIETNGARHAPRARSATTLQFHPATAERWADFEKLFGERGACGGCWCMAWRLPSKDWRAGKGAGNKRAMKRVVNAGQMPGILAYADGEPIGWCAVAPREKYVSLANSRTLKPVDDRPVWSISCLFVDKAHRRQGLSAQLLLAAVDFAAQHGARIVEGYPVEPTMEKMPAPFMWTGIPSAFRAAGFREVVRRSKSRPIMRIEIATKRAVRKQRT